MSKFNIEYEFQGAGTVAIEAEDQQEAEDLFYSGDFSGEDESASEQYEIRKISKTNA